MARTTQQNEAMRAAMRSSVETAGVRVFARHGFAASNIRQIAAEAGISVGSIYRHYESKHELFDALIDQASAGLEAASEHLAGAGDPVTLIHRFVETHVSDLTASDGSAEFSMVMNQCVMTRTPAAAAARLMASQQMLWAAMTRVVSQGQATGQILSGDPATLTAHLFATLAGVTSLHMSLGTGAFTPDAALIMRVLTGAST